MLCLLVFFFFQAEDGIRDLVRSRGLGDVYKRQGVDGEVVHALLGLLDQGVAEDLPGEVFGLAVDLFQRLVDRHRADRHRAVADLSLIHI